MRLSGLVIGGVLALWGILALTAGGMRWLGQQRPAHTFPLPGENGCWQGLCFLQMPVENLAHTLNAHPDIINGSARYLDDLHPGGNFLVEFTYAPRIITQRRVLLYWNPQSYNVTRDWRQPTNPPLMELGDVLRALGPPYQVHPSTDLIFLSYPDRHLQVTIIPRAMNDTHARLTPGDAVISLFVVDPRVSNGAGTVYYPPAENWHGFGIYDFFAP